MSGSNYMMKLNKLTIEEASKKLKSGEITSVDIVNSIFSRIDQVESKVDAYLTLTKEKALLQATESDKRRQEGKTLSQLDGIPIAVKDLFCTQGVRTTAASKILEDFVPDFESSPTEKLWKAGAVLIGKTNLDQFAMGSSTETSAYKNTKNPWDLSRVPGGSSGGSAAAVAADMCLAAIGTDTGGSIRQPASLCGVVGLKPTYGRVSRYGVIAMASSLDTIGPMTKTVADAAILMQILAGSDKDDATTPDVPVPDYSKDLTKDVKGLKIGIPEEFFGVGMDKEVETAVQKSIEELKKMGAEIVPISLPSVKYALAVYYVLMPAEVSSNLARFDGIRYGHSIIKSNLKSQISKLNLEEVYIKSRTEGFGDEAKRRIMLGSYVLSSGYYDAYYKKAQQVRTLVKEDFEAAFKKVDLMLTPVSPTTAFKFGEKTDDPMQMYLSDIHTVPINPAGVPAISIPVGVDSKGLPIGAQIIGPQFSEELIFQAAAALEKEVNFRNQYQPKL